VIGAVLSLGALFSKYHLVFDLVSHFRVQYVVLLIPAFFIAIFAKRSISLLIICVALAVHGYAVTLSFLAEGAPADLIDNPEFSELTVLNSNLLLVNADYEAQLANIKLVNPDIIAFQEYTDAWHNVLSNRLADYPHQAVLPRNGAFGIALYSRFPLVDGGPEVVSSAMPPMINAIVDLGDRQLSVMAVHPPPPVSTAAYDIRNEQLQLIAKRSAVHTDALVVMGDFNTTPWTVHFSDMLTAGKLRNTRAGHGLHPTWPTGNMRRHMLIPIDHILVNERVVVLEFDSKKVDGSDHRTVWSLLRVF